jgi:transposase
MKSVSSFDSIYLWRVPVDFRKSINGLSSIVQEEMKLDAYSSALFIFSCSRRKRIKILYWDRTGFALWYKKLEEDLFPWPQHLENNVVNLTSSELQWVLDGIDFWKINLTLKKSMKRLADWPWPISSIVLFSSHAFN